MQYEVQSRLVTLQYEQIMNSLKKISICIASTIFMGNAIAVTAEQNCSMWASMAKNMATGRDSGVTMKDQNLKIDKLKGKSGITPENITHARKIVSMAYKDLRHVAPSEMERLHYSACMLSD